MQGETVPLPDRGLDFGDGLFETFLYTSGHILYRAYHIARLNRGLIQLGFPDCLSVVERCLDVARQDLVLTHPVSVGAIRLTVTRGSGPRGYAPPEECHPRIIIAFSQLNTDPASPKEAVRTGLSSVHCCVQTSLVGIKHLNRLEQIMASRECVSRKLDEMLMLDEKERLVSAISGNIFLVRDGVLLTPRLDTAGVHGTRRQLLIERWAVHLGIPVYQQDLFLPDIQSSTEMFYTNSLIGLCPIGKFEDIEWDQHLIYDALFAQYQADLK